MLRIKVKKRFPSRSNFYHYCLSRNIKIRNFFSGMATSGKKIFKDVHLCTVQYSVSLNK